MSDSLLVTNKEDDKKAFAYRIDLAAKAVQEALSDKNAYVGPEPEELARRIASCQILPEHGLGFDGMMENVKKLILPNMLRVSSANYMAHLHSAPLQDSLASELLLSAFNQSMDSWDQAPVATETECAVIKFLCKLYGFSPDSDGCFTSGGSQSNLTGILLARDWFCKNKLNHDIKKEGLPECYSKFRLYTSEVSHFSMEKSCHLLGLGYNAVVKVPVDEKQKINIKALQQLLKEDKDKGLIPFCLVATIGTTDFGSIDDVVALRSLADEYGIWLHADAAYGGALVMSSKYCNRMGNLSLCNSLTVDFHKMFLLPISCSAVLVKDKSSFEPLELHADYLNREEDEEDGYTNLVGKSIQTTRRFDALKVWMTFQSYGRDGYASIIDTCIENATYAYSCLCKRPELLPAIEPEISSLVFRLQSNGHPLSDDAHKKIRRLLLLKKGIVIGQTVYGSHTHLKFTLLNPLATHKSIDEIFDTIIELAGNL